MELPGMYPARHGATLGGRGMPGVIAGLGAVAWHAPLGRARRRALPAGPRRVAQNLDVGTWTSAT